MAEYTYMSERAEKVTITSVEQAKRVIKATATVRCLDLAGVLEDKDLTDIADTFGLDLSTLSVTEKPDFNDFPYLYQFKEDIV